MNAAQAVPASQQSSLPVATWFRRLSAAFPQVTFEAVPALAPLKEEKHARPILHIAEGHPEPHAKTGAGKQIQARSRRWASRDPRCLAWQMQLLFRGVAFDCIVVHDDFTHPSHPGEGFAQVPLLLDSDGTVIGRKHLSHWADSVRPFSSDVVSSASTSSAQAFESLLQGPLMAGVLLELLLLPDLSSTRTHVPLLARQLQSALAVQRKARLAAQIAALRPASPTSRVPGWTTSLHGLLNAGPGGFTETGTAGTIDGEEEEVGAVPIEPDQLDQRSIRLEACEAIQAISALFPAGMQESAWACGKGPSHLDALLFAQLHTILSLPVYEGPLRPSSDESLRSAVESAPHLVAFVRRVWNDFVKPRGG